jgi:hypothetical protein
MKRIQLLLSSTLLIGAFNAQALTDYSDFTSSSAAPAPAPQRAEPAPRPAPAQQAEIVRRAPPNRSANHGVRTGAYFHLGGGYEQIYFQGANQTDKVSLTHINGHFQTPWDVFLRTSFWRGQTESAYLTDSSRAQNGNLTTILGFNWLKFGQPHELATVDVYGGAVFAANSDLASSRTDKLAGIETSKRFGDFLVGLGFEYRFHGNARRDWETAIGDGQKLSAVLGWRATPDIQFLVEGATVTIKSGAQDQPNALSEAVTYGYVTPKMGLGIRHFVQLELGARFPTKKASNTSELINARLWDMGGANGTSLFTSLNFVL